MDGLESLGKLGSPIDTFEDRFDTSVRRNVVIGQDDDKDDDTYEYEQGKVFIILNIVDIHIIQPDEYDSRYQKSIDVEFVIFQLVFYRVDVVVILIFTVIEAIIGKVLEFVHVIPSKLFAIIAKPVVPPSPPPTSQ